MPPLLRVLLSALSQMRLWPEGSCQSIFVSLIHFASLGLKGDLERILEPLEAFDEVDMNERWRKGIWLNNRNRRANGAILET